MGLTLIDKPLTPKSILVDSRNRFLKYLQARGDQRAVYFVSTDSRRRRHQLSYLGCFDLVSAGFS